MYQFGVGGMFGNPVGGNQGTPSGPQWFGTLQDASIDIDQQLVELRGQYKFPDDVAPGNMTIKGKAAFGKIETSIFNSLFFAETIATGIKVIYANEAHSIPGSGPYTVTVTNASGFSTDLGVIFSATGAPLALITGTPTTGQYAVNSSTGVYTFAAADTALGVNISYTQTSASGKTVPITNRNMGYGPVFELYLSMSYQGTNGLHLFACRSSKMSFPLKRDNYMIPDFEFEGYANAAGNVAEMYQISA